MATHSYHSRKSGGSSSSKSSSSSGTHSFHERGYSKESKTTKKSSEPSESGFVSLEEAATGHAAKVTPARRGVAGIAVDSTTVSREEAAKGHAAKATTARRGVAGIAVDSTTVSREEAAKGHAAKATTAQILSKTLGVSQDKAGRFSAKTQSKLLGGKALSPKEIKEYTNITGKKYTGKVASPEGFSQKLSAATKAGQAAQRDFLKSAEAKEYIKLKHGLTDAQLNAIYKKGYEKRYAVSSPEALAARAKEAAAKAKEISAKQKPEYRAPVPTTKAEQAARRLDIDPKLSKYFTEYEISTVMGAQSMTVKSDKARDMYKNMLEKRAKGGKPRVITKEQVAAMDRQAKREQALIKKRNLQEYKPLLDKNGKEIPRFGAVIKDGKVTGTSALKGKGVKGVISGKYYLSKAEHTKVQKINQNASKQITAKTNPLEKRRILDARQQIMKSLPGKDATQALRYFSSLDSAVPISAMIPTKQETARVTERLVQAGIAELAGTKYTEAQKRRIVETKLKRKPIAQDLKADWGKLDKKLSTGLNLPTESEIAAHRDRTFGKIPGFTQWQKDFVKKTDANPVAKGFKDFSKGEYERLRNKPATYGAELAAMFIGGAVLGAVTKGGTIITKAGLAKAATRSTRPMVKAGLLKAVKHLDTMVAAGYITPIVAQGITASWEDKFKLSKGLLIGGAGYAKGSSRIGAKLAGLEVGSATSSTPGKFEAATKKALSKEGMKEFIRNEKADIVSTPVHSIESITPEGKIKLKLEYYEIRNGKGEIIGKEIGDTFISAEKAKIPKGKESVKIVEANIKNGKPVKVRQSIHKLSPGQKDLSLKADKSGVKSKKLTPSQKAAAKRKAKQEIKAEAPKVEKLAPEQIRKVAKEKNLDVIVEKEIEIVEVGKTGDPYKDFKAVERYVATDSTGKVLSKDIEKFPLDLKKFAGDSAKIVEAKAGRQGQVLIQKQKVLPVSETQTKIKLKVGAKSIQKIRTRLLEDVKQPEKTRFEAIGKRKTQSQRLAEAKARKEKAKTVQKTKTSMKTKASQIKNMRVKSKMLEYIKAAPIATIAQRTKALETVDLAAETGAVPAVAAKTISATWAETKVSDISKEVEAKEEKIKKAMGDALKPITVPIVKPVTPPDVKPVVPPTIKPITTPVVTPIVTPKISEISDTIGWVVDKTKGDVEEALKEAIEEITKTPPPKPPKETPPKELPPIIPPLPGYRRKKKKPLTKKEKVVIDSMSRTIRNKLGDINSILG